MEALRSIEIAAERLGVSPWTIRAWAANGRMKSVKLGSRRMIPESEILRVMADGINSVTEESHKTERQDSRARPR
jgi:excisionase family DNA binding protein